MRRLIVVLVTALAGTALAQQSPVKAQLTQQIRAAGENLDLGDNGEAIAGLARALGTIRQQQLQSDPIAADVEAMLATALALSNHGNDAVGHFRAALRINGQVKLDLRWATKQAVQMAYQAARGEVAPPIPKPLDAPAEKASAPQPEPEDNGPVTGIRARAMAAAQAGQALPIQVRVGDDIGKPAKVVLAYRSGAGKFTEVAMKSGSEGFQATIPADAVKLPSLQYYVEARDAKNRPLARRGNPDRPLAITVAEAAAPAPVKKKRASQPAESTPAATPAAVPPAPTKKKSGEDEENPFDSEHDPTKVVPKAPSK